MPVDEVARFPLPLPDPVDEGLAADVAPRDPFVAELTLDDHLRGNAGVIRAWLPQRIAAPHALMADEDVLQGIVEGMAHVQASRHIGRRDDNGIGPGVVPSADGKGTALLPFLVETALRRCRVPVLVHHVAFHQTPSGG